MHLSGRSSRVPFLNHGFLPTELTRWAEDREPWAVRVLAGPAGVGKTRTAAQLCQELDRRGWATGFLAADVDLESVNFLAQIRQARLVVVDSDWDMDRLAETAARLATHASVKHPVRMVVARRTPPVPVSGPEWDLGGRFGPTTVDTVAGLGTDRSVRQRLFEATVGAFGGRGMNGHDPEELDAGLYTNPLMVSIGALLAVDGSGALPQTAPRLLEQFVAGPEVRSWRLGDSGLEADPIMGTVLPRKVVAVVSLTGADDEDTDVELLGLLRDLASTDEQYRRAWAHWARQMYGGPWFWYSVGPELVAEYLVGSSLADEPAVIRRALCGQNLEGLVRALERLGWATPQYPELASAVASAVDEELAPLCRQAVAVVAKAPVAAALARLIGVCPPDPARLPAVLDDIPTGAGRDVTKLAAVLTEQALAQCRRRAEEESGAHQAALATCLNNLSVRLAELGRPEEALAAVSEAVWHFHAVAHADSGAYGLELATVESNHSYRLAALGRREEAAATAGQAVTVWRQVAQTEPRYGTELVRALIALSVRTAELGRRDAALAAAQEAVAASRRLVGTRPNGSSPELAQALRQLSSALARCGRHEEARAASVESVSHYRQLAHQDPYYWPQLAAALDDLAGRLAAVNRRKEAAAAAAEAQSLRLRVDTNR
ncbi:MAG TPA: tetratricopeptide repeat protein [Acidimicrobiales bacterium]|jgi:tetratricopeptide (TPR) repeat protein|nr:tetratricopeptide repeat protein [Acidimicrobiales bacterium]